MKNEKWIDARMNGMDLDLYQVSDQGRVRVKEHSITFMRQGKLSVRLCKAHSIKPHDNGLGYQQVTLSIDGQSKAVLVHRLVMDSFNPDYDDSLTDIDHVNCLRGDNRLANLKRVSHAENLRQPHRMKLIRKPVRVVSADHTVQWVFNSVSEAAEWLGVQQGYLSHILHNGNQIDDLYVYFKD